MQQKQDQTGKMFFGTEQEVFDLLVREDHAFRKLKNIINFSEVVNPLRRL